jgi:fumarylacetoacetase
LERHEEVLQIVRSWVADANNHPDFPLANLPFGIVSPGGAAPRPAIAIGDQILDLQAAVEAGLLSGAARDAVEATGTTLNKLLACGGDVRRAIRDQVTTLLAEGSPAARLSHRLLHAAADCTLHLPCAIGDYTDFYAGIHHATHVGRLLRPDNPLMPNYKYLPVAYNGRASTVRPSGAPVRRPNGQRKPAADPTPSFGPSRNLDFELELGIWIGTGNALGEPIPMAEAADHIAGYCLLNDWSARDIQGWEYQPLGPFLAKNLLTTISPWIVTPEALAPFRVPAMHRDATDPPLFAHLSDDADQQSGGLDVALEISILTPTMRSQSLSPHPIGTSNARFLFWTPAQMVAHHASNGCMLQPGDLFGSGTVSGPGRGQEGSLLEMTEGGREPIQLPSGETRRFLEDGDRIALSARATDSRVSIGFGLCEGTVIPAPAST